MRQHRRVVVSTTIAVGLLLGAAGCGADAASGRAEAPADTSLAQVPSSSTPAAPTAEAPAPEVPAADGPVAERPGRDGPPLAPGSAGELSAADGFIVDGGAVSPFADQLPAIANLSTELRAALQAAARAAAADGVQVLVTSGWRSTAYQQFLFDEAVRRYGSAEEARRYVLAPDQSEHVTGQAVDVGRTDATSWLSQHGADHGLCQTYANESWHYELATTPGGECPEQLSDATAG